MSDENNTDNGDWGLDSLDEDDDVIELTEEVEPPAKPAASGQLPPGDEVIDLEDETAPQADEQIHELVEEEEAEAVIDFENETIPPPQDKVHELMEAAMEDVDVEDLQPLDDDEQFVIDLGEDVALPDGEELHDHMEAEVEELDIEELQPFEEMDEITVDSEEELVPLPDEEALDLPETVTGKEQGTGIGPDDEPSAEPIEARTGPDEDIIDISDFDQQYPDSEDADVATTGLPTADAGGEEEYLELLDVDEDDDGAELDDDIIQFDDGGSEESALEMNDPAPVTPEMEFESESPIVVEDEMSGGFRSSPADEPPEEFGDAEFIQEAEQEAEFDTVAPIFGSSPVREDNLTQAPDIRGGQEQTGAMPQTEDADRGDAPSIPAAVSSDQIEAAVASIIERDYAGRIEGMVAAAIEKVVSLEIERIKAKLFSEEED